MDPLALGHPGWPAPTPSWDWWPLVGVALVLVIGTRSLGLHLTVPAVAVAIALGPCFATVVHTWGVAPAVALVMVARAVAVRMRSPDRRGNPPRSV